MNQDLWPTTNWIWTSVRELSGENENTRTIIKIPIKFNNTTKNLYVISTYSPGNIKTNFIEDLNELVTELNLENDNNYYFLAGDINVRHTVWQDHTNNYRWISLLNWLKDNQIKYRAVLSGPESPTFPMGGSYLDLVILVNNKIKVEPYDSDHNAICTKIKIENLNEFLFTQNSSKIKYNYKKTNWNKFQINLQKTNVKIIDDVNLNNIEIDRYVDVPASQMNYIT